MTKFNELKNELLGHPPYSPDLAITAVDGYFAELPKSHYRDGKNYWRIIGISVLKLREIILNKKNIFRTKNSIYSFRAKFNWKSEL